MDIIFPVADGKVIETPEDLEAQKKIEFELGAKYQVLEKRHESIGGCAANVSLGLARLNLETYCCTRMGSDQTGDWIKKEMEKNGVRIDLVQTGEGHKSDLSAIIANIPSGDRIIFSDRDSNEKLEILPEEMKKVGAGWIFVSSLNGNGDEGWEGKVDKILDLVGRENLKLIFNPGQKNIKSNPQKVIDAVSRSQILIINKDEAIEIVDKSGSFEEGLLNDEKFLAGKLNELGAQTIAMTDGLRGAWIYDKGNFLHMEAKKGKVSDSLGAGDAFSSGFIAAYIKGKNTEECLRWGITNAASVVEHYGAVNGLLKEEEINII